MVEEETQLSPQEQPSVQDTKESQIYTEEKTNNEASLKPTSDDLQNNETVPELEEEKSPEPKETTPDSEDKPKRKFDARADELFRKQMQEIEQEINRRIQNRNVRKVRS